MPGIISKLSGFAEWKLKAHRELMLKKGKLTKEEWLSINTDGPSCPLAKVYNANEAASLFSKFARVRQEIWEFNSEHWSPLDKLIPVRVERWIGRKWGWHRIITGTK